MPTRFRVFIGTLALVGLVAVTIAFPILHTARAGFPPSFTGTPLLLSDGSSEPEISIGASGTMAMVSLQWPIGVILTRKYDVPDN